MVFLQSSEVSVAVKDICHGRGTLLLGTGITLNTAGISVLDCRLQANWALPQVDIFTMLGRPILFGAAITSITPPMPVREAQ